MKKEGESRMYDDFVHSNFIVFDGAEGTGKTTQIKILADRLRALGLEVICTREPGGTPCGDRIRSILLARDNDPPTGWAEFFLFMAARTQHVTFIMNELAQGKYILCDRFSSSTFAYQGYGRGLENDHMEELYRIDQTARQGLLPELAILLDQDVGVGLLKKYKQSGAEVTRFEDEMHEFHERVRSGFLKYARQSTLSRWEIIRADQSIEAVSEAIWDVVKRHLHLEKQKEEHGTTTKKI